MEQTAPRLISGGADRKVGCCALIPFGPDPSSVFTTFIFWGFEYVFDVLGQGSNWRYVGAVIGLVIGYRVKYTLDRDFVFGSARV